MIIKYLKNNFLFFVYNSFADNETKADPVAQAPNPEEQEPKKGGEPASPIDGFFTKDQKKELTGVELERVEQLLKRYNELMFSLRDNKLASTIPKQRLDCITKGLAKYKIDPNEDKVERQDIEVYAENNKQEAEVFQTIIWEIEFELEWINNEINMAKIMKASNDTNLANPALTEPAISNLIRYYENRLWWEEKENSDIKGYLKRLYEIRFIKKETPENIKKYNELLKTSPEILWKMWDFERDDFTSISISERLKYVTLERKDFSELKALADTENWVEFTISYDFWWNINENFEKQIDLFMLLPGEVWKVYVWDQEYIRNSKMWSFIWADWKPLVISDWTKIKLKRPAWEDKISPLINWKDQVTLVKQWADWKPVETVYKKVDWVFRLDWKADWEILIFKEWMKVKNTDWKDPVIFTSWSVRKDYELKQIDTTLSSIKDEYQRTWAGHWMEPWLTEKGWFKFTSENVEADISDMTKTAWDVSRYTKENLSAERFKDDFVKLLGYLFPWMWKFLESLQTNLQDSWYWNFPWWAWSASESSEWGGSVLWQELADFCQKNSLKGKGDWNCALNVWNALQKFGKISNISGLRWHWADWWPNMSKRKDFYEITDKYDVVKDRKTLPAWAIISYARNTQWTTWTDDRRDYWHVEVALWDWRFFFWQVSSHPGWSNPDPKRWDYRIFMPWTPIDSVRLNSATWLSNVDLRPLASKYPNEASIKNNNPAWVTWNPAFAETLRSQWVKFHEWTARPSKEWWKYFWFDNLWEWMKAYDILWERKLKKFWNRPFKDLASNWAVDTRSYQKMFWDIWERPVSSLSDQEIRRIQAKQKKIESPWMYTELRRLGYFANV